MKETMKFLDSVNKAKTDDEFFSEKHADQAKSLIRKLLGNDSLFKEKKVRLLPIGTEVKFSQMNELTGQQMIFSGVVIGHAKEIRKLWEVEVDEIVDPVYLVLRKDDFGNTFHHMVDPSEIIANKEEI